MEPQDLAALIGVLAICEGEMMLMEPTGRLLTNRLAVRLHGEGLLPAEATERQVRQAVNDLNHRLRYAKGEYDHPLEPQPVPEL